MLFTPDSGFVILRPTPLQIRQFAFFSHLDMGKKRWSGSAGKMSEFVSAREQKNCGLKF